jgi:hypothetical protein
MENVKKQKERGGSLTAWLILMIIMNIGVAIFYLVGRDLITRIIPTFPEWAFIVFPIVGFINAFFAYLVFAWRKIGFYGLVATFIISFVLNMTISINPNSFVGIAGIVILYLLLRPKWHLLK